MVQWLVPQPLSAVARTLLDDSDPLFAPALAKSECANALYRYVHAGTMQADDALLRLRALLDSDVAFVDDSAVHVTALALACGLSRPVYDLEYVALAVSLGATLITADRRLYRLCEGLSTCDVRLLGHQTGDEPPPGS